MCELITGCMFAGKTSELVRRVREHQAAGRVVVVLTHARDTRYTAAAALASHDGATVPARAVANLCALLPLTAAVVAVDEAQFFDAVDLSAFLTCVDAPALLVAGLSADLHRQPWPAVEAARALATHVTVLHARCADCDAPAEWTRYTGATPLAGNVRVGGADVWAPVCGAHWK